MKVFEMSKKKKKKRFLDVLVGSLLGDLFTVLSLSFFATPEVVANIIIQMILVQGCK